MRASTRYQYHTKIKLMLPDNESLCLFELLTSLAQKQPDKPAIIAPNKLPLTYQALITLIQAIHEQLNLLGLGPGNRVATALPNSPEALSAFLAIGATTSCAPLNPQYTTSEFISYLSDIRPDALVTLCDNNTAANQAAKELQIPILQLISNISPMAGSFSLQGQTNLPQVKTPYASPNDIGLLLHTSGSTSTPKLVPVLQKTMCYTCINVANCLTLTAQDRCLNTGLLFHTHGLLSGGLMPLSVGGSCVYLANPEPGQFIAYLHRFDPTWYPASPTLHQALFEQMQKTPKFHKNPALRFIRSSTSPLPAYILQGLEKLLDIPLIESYGMTESPHISSNRLPPAIRKKGSAGVSLGNKISIVDKEGNCVAPTTIGEIVVQGPTVMPGYIDNPLVNQTAFCRYGFRTGDLGYLDADGYLFITGRLKDIINRGGEKISPYEVDTVLLAHPEVKAVACFSVPHSSLGEDIAAAIVIQPDSDLDAETVRQFAYQHLAAFKVPYRIIMCEQLPKGPTGKVQRHKLVSHFAKQLSAFDRQPVATTITAPLLTPVQAALLSIWQDVLNNAQITINDHFLALGGDSIRALMVKTRIETLLNIPVPYEILYDCPTIAATSDYLSQHFAQLILQWESAQHGKEIWML